MSTFPKLVQDQKLQDQKNNGRKWGRVKSNPRDHAPGNREQKTIDPANLYWFEGSSETTMVLSRIKPQEQQVAEAARRAEQTRRFRRNQIFGLLMIAAAIFVYWVIRTKPGWVLPAGWWRP